jgi:hypothetical protein
VGLKPVTTATTTTTTTTTAMQIVKLQMQGKIRTIA